MNLSISSIHRHPLFAKRVFGIAGIYGLIVLLPQYFTERQMGSDFPPPVTHPEFYYGFLGVTLAWQVLFLFISRDPLHYRLMMIPALIEKLSFVTAVCVLLAQSRVPTAMVPFAVIDLLLAVLFAVAYFMTPSSSHSPGSI